jgi:hypothetical protein
MLDGRDPGRRVPTESGQDGPETAWFYSAVVDRLLSHDGLAALARHVGDAVLKEDSRGTRLAKEHKDSKRRIDAAVAAVMTHERAAILAGDRGEHPRLMSDPSMSKRPRERHAPRPFAIPSRYPFSDKKSASPRLGVTWARTPARGWHGPPGVGPGDRWAQAVSRPVGPAQAGRAWTPVGRLPPSRGGCRSHAG